MTGVPHYGDDDLIGPHHHDALWAEFTSAQRAAFGSGQRKKRMMFTYWDNLPNMLDWEMTHDLERQLGRPVSHDSVKAMRNTLMRQGWVIRTGIHRIGPYGAPGEAFRAITPGSDPIPLVRSIRPHSEYYGGIGDEEQIRQILRVIAMDPTRADYREFADRLVRALAEPGSPLRRYLDEL
jgi:hypothetical protein